MKEMLTSTVLPWLITAAITAVCAILLFGGQHVVAWLKARAATSKLAFFTSIVAEHLVAAFAEVEATMKPKLIAALSDGKLTPEEAAGLKAALVAQVMTTLPAFAKAVGVALFGDVLPSVIGAQVQAAASSSTTLAAVAPVAVAAMNAPLVTGVPVPSMPR